MKSIKWDIRRQGRAWERSEALERFDLTPEKTEMVGGRLYFSEEERLAMLGLLLENVGIDKAIRMGDIRLWKEAIEEVEKGETER